MAEIFPLIFEFVEFVVVKGEIFPVPLEGIPIFELLLLHAIVVPETLLTKDSVLVKSVAQYT